MTLRMSTKTWIIRSCGKTAPKVRLFCFPYAGGGASVFRAWDELVPCNLEICSVQYPGREHRIREGSFTAMEPLVAELVTSLEPYLDLPSVFFGHSMGALVGFECARRLRAQMGFSLGHLFVSACAAPQLAREVKPSKEWLDDELIDKVRKLNGTPDAVFDNEELKHLILPILRADFTLCARYIYVPSVPLDCPISAFGGLQDEGISREDLQAWSDQTASTFNLRMFSGDHFYLHTARQFLLDMLHREIALTLR